MSTKIECVMHFAAYAYVGESVTEPLAYYRNNVATTVGVLEAMAEVGVRNFVFSSTCATYGDPDERCRSPRTSRRRRSARTAAAS